MLTEEPILQDTAPAQTSAVVSRPPSVRPTRSPQHPDHQRPSRRRARASRRGPQRSQTNRLESPVKASNGHQPPPETYAPLPASTCHCEAPTGMVYVDDDGDLTCALCGHSPAVATPGPAVAAGPDRNAVL